MTTTKYIKSLFLLLISLLLPRRAWVAGTDAVSFLDIPAGAAPAALGSAYTALANDAYATTWNPAGLGRLPSSQLAAQRLSYLESTNYDYLGFVHPIASRNASEAHDGLGVAIQYFSAGDTVGRDHFGSPMATFSSRYSAYALAYGHSFDSRCSFGLAGKIINVNLGGVSGHALASDIGGLYEAPSNVWLGFSLTNLGNRLMFLNEGDSLPTALHVGAAYRPKSPWQLGTEMVYRRSGLVSGHIGVQWQPLSIFSLRLGYRTDIPRELSALAGLTFGCGILLRGQEVAFAWVPLGELGSSQYLSLLLRFGEAR